MQRECIASLDAVLSPEPQEREIERLNLVVVLRTLPKDVLGKASDVRDVELDRLRRAAREILGEQVGELQARKRVGVDGSVAAVDTGSADAFLEPASISLTENVPVVSDQKRDLHGLALPLCHERIERRRRGVALARIQVSVPLQDERTPIGVTNALGNPFRPVPGSAHQRDCGVPKHVERKRVVARRRKRGGGA